MKKLYLILIAIYLGNFFQLSAQDVDKQLKKRIDLSYSIGIAIPPTWGMKLSTLNNYKYPNFYKRVGELFTIGIRKELTTKTSYNFLLNYYYFARSFATNDTVLNAGVKYHTLRGTNMNIFNVEYSFNTMLFNPKNKLKPFLNYGINLSYINNTKGVGLSYPNEKETTYQKANHWLYMGLILGVGAQYMINSNISLTCNIKAITPLTAMRPLSFYNNISPIVSFQVGIYYKI